MKNKILFITHGIDTVNFREDLLLCCQRVYEVYVLFPFSVAEDDRAQLESKGIVCHDLKLNQHGMSPFAEKRTYISILNTLKKIKPDVVFNYTIKPIIWGSLAASRSSIACIYSLVPGRGRMLKESRSLVRRGFNNVFFKLYRKALSMNHRVFFLNTDDRDFFLDCNLIESTKTRILNSEGVSLNRFNYLPYIKPASGEIVFFMMARVMRDKGVFEYLEAANQLVLTHSNAIFKLAGAIDDRISKKDSLLFERLTKHSRIEFVGRISNVVEYLGSCAVFVLPSFYQEGLPRSILEAMAIGRPIITTDWTGCRDTVTDGVNGYLVNIKSTHDLVEKMKNFLCLENPTEKILAMGKASRMMVEEKHDVNKVNHEIMKILSLKQEVAV